MLSQLTGEEWRQIIQEAGGQAVAVITAISALIMAARAQSQSRQNTNRLDYLENGGGDEKIDKRLVALNLIEEGQGKREATMNESEEQPPKWPPGTIG